MISRRRVISAIIRAILFGVPLFGENFEPWVIMILPPGGFLTLGLMMGVFAHVAERRKQAREQAAARAAAPEGGTA